MTLPARTVWAMLPKGMTFASGAGSDFESSPQDPGFQTFVAKNAMPGKALEFTVSGSGSLPREDQSAQSGQQAASGMGGQDNGGQEAGAPGRQPGGGLGNPIDTPDPLSKYKWWILGVIALVMVASAALLLRKPGDGTAFGYMADPRAGNTPAAGSPAARQTALLDALKEELFALESEKIAGTLPPEEYATVKAALETVLKRALKRQ
jgi:hypothetical protein